MKTKILSYALVLALGSALCFTSPLPAKNTVKSDASKTEIAEQDAISKAHKKPKKLAKHSNAVKKKNKAEKISE